MTENDSKFYVEIESTGIGKIKPKVVSIKWAEDVTKHVSIGNFVLNDKTSKIFKNVERFDKIHVKVINLKSKKVVARFSGLIDKMTNEFERDKNTKKIIKSNTIIEARSLPSILTRNNLEGTFRFINGYGEIVKKIASKYGFDTSSVKLVKMQGVIHFKSMSILEAFRRMAYLQNWRIYFRDDKIFFEPVKPPEDSGITITGEDMTKGGFTKF